MTADRPTLAYADPGTPRKRFSTYACALTLGPVIVLLLYAFAAAPGLDRLLSRFGTRLPQPTEILLSVGRWLANDFGWVALALLPAATGFLAAVVPPAPDRAHAARRRRTAAGIAMVTILLSLALILWAAYLPWLNVMRTVSSPRR